MSMCISQVNEDEKRAQIDQMDQIYSGSYLALVALDGPNAD
jgi:hypothetical protein